MLIDDFLPEYHHRHRHETTIDASAGAVREGLEQWRPDTSFLWRLLLRLRGLGRPLGSVREWAEANGFIRLAEDENEMVYGQIGRFWAIDEARAFASPKTVEEFLAFADPRFAAAALSLRVESISPTRTRLVTETRVRALGRAARRRFRLYWLFIGPFSALLRRAMLRGVKAIAEAATR